MKPVEIKDGIHWVGVVDWKSRNFHRYSISPMGTTYNAFFVEDEKKVLVDTVKHDHLGRYLCAVAHVTDIEDVDYLVVNHLEPDHSGCLKEIVERAKPEKIFTSPLGEKAMKTYFHSEDWPVEVVKTGDQVSIGKRTLTFYETRMLHWPDNMLTHVSPEKVAFSSDAFGQNWATSERFADEVDRPTLDRLMAEYYANIVLPYSPQVLKTLDALGEAGVEIDILCPDHGLMFRGKDVAYALEKYRAYAEQKPVNKGVVIYDTMWDSTEKMAHAVVEGLAEEGMSVRVMAKEGNHHSRIMNEVFDAAVVCIGSPTHNNGILPGMADMLTYMKGLRPQNKIGGAFGSFGWSGECVKILNQWLEDMKFEVQEPNIKAKHVPDHDTLKECVELGRNCARAAKTKWNF